MLRTDVPGAHTAATRRAFVSWRACLVLHALDSTTGNGRTGRLLTDRWRTGTSPDMQAAGKWPSEQELVRCVRFG